MRVHDSEAASSNWRAGLREAMEKVFGEDDLKKICFDLEYLGYRYDELGEGSTSTKIIELIQMAQRKGHLLDLVDVCAQHRRNIPWAELRREIESGLAAPIPAESAPAAPVDAAATPSPRGKPSSPSDRARSKRWLTVPTPGLIAILALVVLVVGGGLVLRASEPKVACQDAGNRWGTTLYARYSERLGCPITSESETLGAYQLYEKGVMVWQQDDDRVYALYDKGSFADLDGAQVPRGYYKDDFTKGAFGYFWSTDTNVERALGKAVAVEDHATNFAYQDFERGVIFYFLENEANNYVLFRDDNTWVKTPDGLGLPPN